MRIVASFEYAGMADYWGGNGRRWDNDAGCLFAYYGKGTTLREIIDSAADDFSMSGEFDDMAWDDFDSDDVRSALLDCLTDQGRRDYKNDAVSECALEYAAANGLDVCVTDEDCDDDEFSESPVCIFLLELTE